MKYAKYPIDTSNSHLQYEFYSKGPGGKVLKSVIYEQFEDSDVYNLSFGDVRDDFVDDFIVTDNKDTELILATVADTARMFFDAYPGKWIFFKGSTVGRTRLYQMAISKNFEELNRVYHILGLIGLNVTPFKKNVTYDGFYITTKTISFVQS